MLINMTHNIVSGYYFQSSMMYSMVLLLGTLLLVSSSNANQQCGAPRFSCDFNDPCDPPCVPGQSHYPGRGARLWVECVEGQCTENRCPRRTTWNQANQRCQGANGLETRCAFGRFDCAAHNPCNPSLCEGGVMQYLGVSPRRYVTCDLQGGCSEEQCPRRQEWDQEGQRCRRRNPDGSGDDTVEFKNRCDLPKFNCLKRNPCFPTRCTDDVDIYPGIGRGNYVTCENLACQEEFCPVGQTFDESSSQCVESGNDDAECSWQEISVPTPVDDCTDEYTFENTKYSERERGWRYLDGFIDCENASEGNNYYVEDRDVTDTAPSDYFVTCHPADGLCFRLKYSVFGDGGWDYFVFDITGPNRIVSPEYALNDEVHSDCVEMDYFDEPAVGFAVADEADCRNKGGKFWYVRPPTYYGSCSGQIPCSVASSSSVTIYEYVCE